MLISAILLIAIATVNLIYENITVGTAYYTISSSEIPDSFDSFKIAQISDFHNADFGGNACILDILKTEKPDIIALTGDFVDSRHTNIDVSLKFIREAVKIAPCYYVTGNHESRLAGKYELLEKELIRYGVTVLHNQSVTLEKNGDTIIVAGIDDPDFSCRESRMFDFS